MFEKKGREVCALYALLWAKKRRMIKPCAWLTLEEDYKMLTHLLNKVLFSPIPLLPDFDCYQFHLKSSSSRNRVSFLSAFATDVDCV